MPLTCADARIGGTLKDNALSPAFQDIMIGQAAIARVTSLDAGHSVSLTKPDALIAALVSSAAA
jgi:hypothetical protein